MLNFMTECDNLARLLGTGLINAALPSLLIVMLTFVALQPKRINSATRVWVWSFVLALLVYLPMQMIVRRPPASVPKQIRTTLAPMPLTGGVWSGDPTTVLRSSGSRALSFRHWESGIAAAALLFVAVRFLRLLAGLVRAVKLKEQATAMPPHNFGNQIDRLLHSNHSWRRVSIAVSEQITVPVVVGYWRPAILFPAYLVETVDLADVEKVLLHELAHVHRYDDWALLLQRTVESAFAFHPLVQFAGRQINLHREIACDDRVLSFLQPKAYAMCLARIAELTGVRRVMDLSPSFVEQKSQLGRRLESILDGTRQHMPVLSVRYLASFAGAAALLCFVSLKTPALVAYPVEAVDQIPTQASVQTPSTAIERQPSAARQTLPSGSATAPVARAETDSKADSIDSLTITSGDENSFYDQNYGGDSQGSSNFPRNAIIYRKNGTRWVIRDPKILSEAQAIFRPQDELGKQQAALGAQQAKLGEAQADLGAQQAVFADRKLEPAQMQALQQQLRRLEANIRSLVTDGVEKTTSEAQGQLANLQAQLGEMQSRMGQEQAKYAGEQAKLGAAQAQLGGQQAYLGAQQSKLGSAQAREAKVAQGKLHELIRRAEAQHLSKPLL